ncbi:MAG TPA: alpha-amylase family glycosyl hydrolase [Phototrophicaceae bacterium]|nr:alpha-amylase family glycosyl hydrolase [Phototrophicaceae bacterium]
MPASKGIEFKLFAPYNDSVSLIGDWNSWEPIPMKKDKKGFWKVSVPLGDGEYQYKFRVKSKSYFSLDETVDVFDPYATHLSGDQFENSCIIIQQGQPVVTTYQWRHDKQPLPANKELVIYELHVGDFTGGPGDGPQGGPKSKGRFGDVLDKLDYLADLGVGAVELMPVKEFPGEQSWGYVWRSLFAIERAYGSPDELAQLIDELHGRGIRVILDMVFNHSDLETPLTKINYEYWYYKDNPDAPHLRWGPKLNYTHHDANLDVWPARQYAWDAIEYWLDHFHIDGIRFDAALVLNRDFLTWVQQNIYQKIGDIKPFYTIAECIPQDPGIAGPDGPLDAAWHEHFYRQLICTTVGAPTEGREPFNLEAIINVLDPRRDGFSGTFNVVNYLNSHDENRLLWQISNAGGFYDESAFRRNKLGAGLLLTAPGVPMFWMGEEFGESAPRTMEYQPLDWALLQNDTNSGLLHFYQGLIKLKRTTSALQNDTFEVILRDDNRGLLAYKRWDDAGGVVVVVANLRHQYAGEFVLENVGLEDGSWHEYVFNYDNTVQNGVLRDTLAESEIKIFVKR